MRDVRGLLQLEARRGRAEPGTAAALGAGRILRVHALEDDDIRHGGDDGHATSAELPVPLAQGDDPDVELRHRVSRAGGRLVAHAATLVQPRSLYWALAMSTAT